MTNKFDDDFNFDSDDLFGDDNSLADSSSGAGNRANAQSASGGFDDLDDPFGDDSFDFGGDDSFGDVNMDDDDIDLDLGGDEPDVIGAATAEDPEAVQGNRRFRNTLIALGGVLLVQVLIILGLVLFGGGPSGPNPAELTTTAIVAINETTFFQSTQTAVARGATQTQDALLRSITATPSPTATNTRPPSATPVPSLDPTDLAATAFQLGLTSTVEASTAIAQATNDAAATLTARPTETPDGPNEQDIFATSTALAQLFNQLTQQAVDAAASTVESGTAVAGAGTAVGSATPVGGTLVNRDELPDAGLFDDFNAGNGLGMIVLSALGLLGVIFFTRRLRAENDTDEK
ncbi:MAG: hypothetical protein ACOYL5_05605 [Phototrophicaceae bacterium]